MLSPSNIRHEGNIGNGRVTVREVLRLVPDGGGGGAELTPSK